MYKNNIVLPILCFISFFNFGHEFKCLFNNCFIFAQVGYTTLGDNYEPFEGEWADVPLAYAKMTQTPAIPDLTAQLEKQIAKAAGAQDDAVVAVMKEVRSLLLKMSKGGE